MIITEVRACVLIFLISLALEQLAGLPAGYRGLLADGCPSLAEYLA